MTTFRFHHGGRARRHRRDAPPDVGWNWGYWPWRS